MHGGAPGLERGGRPVDHLQPGHVGECPRERGVVVVPHVRRDAAPLGHPVDLQQEQPGVPARLLREDPLVGGGARVAAAGHLQTFDRGDDVFQEGQDGGPSNFGLAVIAALQRPLDRPHPADPLLQLLLGVPVGLVDRPGGLAEVGGESQAAAGDVPGEQGVQARLGEGGERLADSGTVMRARTRHAIAITITAPPITNARVGSQFPAMSRKPRIFAGFVARSSTIRFRLIRPSLTPKWWIMCSRFSRPGPPFGIFEKSSLPSSFCFMQNGQWSVDTTASSFIRRPFQRSA